MDSILIISIRRLWETTVIRSPLIGYAGSGTLSAILTTDVSLPIMAAVPAGTSQVKSICCLTLCRLKGSCYGHPTWSLNTAKCTKPITPFLQ